MSGYDDLKRAFTGNDAPPARAPFRLVRFKDVPLPTTAPYLVKDIIPREGLVVIWGPPKCGKSFWTFDVLMHVAEGWLYRERRTRQGPSVYVACEGERGLLARSAAYRQRHDIGDPPFHLVTTKLNLPVQYADLVTEIRAQMGDEAPVAIAIDTLNRSIAGSESDDRDMGDYVKAADAVREAFGCAVLVVHHCGIEGTRPRGHTSLTGADAQLAVKRDAEKNVVVTIEYMKDGGAEGEQIVSRLEVVDVAEDENGEPITSCVVVPAEDAGRARVKVTGPAKLALDKLHDCLCDLGRGVTFSDVTEGGSVTSSRHGRHIPAGAKIVTVEQWREHLKLAGIINAEKGHREQFRRIQARLQEAGLIGIWDGQVWSVTSVTGRHSDQP
jgi:hypothetical protein